MAASRSDISRWFDQGVADGASHMIIKCDTFESSDSCCYPVYVEAGKSAREVAGANGDRTMECYALNEDKGAQLAQSRANNWN